MEQTLFSYLGCQAYFMIIQAFHLYLLCPRSKLVPIWKGQLPLTRSDMELF